MANAWNLCGCPFSYRGAYNWPDTWIPEGVIASASPIGLMHQDLLTIECFVETGRLIMRFTYQNPVSIIATGFDPNSGAVLIHILVENYLYLLTLQNYDLHFITLVGHFPEQGDEAPSAVWRLVFESIIL